MCDLLVTKQLKQQALMFSTDLLFTLFDGTDVRVLQDNQDNTWLVKKIDPITIWICTLWHFCNDLLFIYHNSKGSQK